jgi:hypothetical protein
MCGVRHADLQGGYQQISSEPSVKSRTHELTNRPKTPDHSSAPKKNRLLVSALLTQSLDGFELSYRNPVVLTVHCLLRSNQSLEFQNAANTKWQFQLDAVP